MLERTLPGVHVPAVFDPDDPRQIHVGMSEWQRGSGDAVLNTQGLATCIGVATLDPRTRIGHLGHFSDPFEEVADLDEMLASAVSGVTDRKSLSVWVRGGALPTILTQGDVLHVKARRDLVLGRISILGLPKPDVKWGNRPGICYGIALECGAGTCAIEEAAW